ncbi:hypothetical protein PDESU_03022 [Pontiella desulfatans]|uniref:Uncharacterized protein n=1 Tax=Pontiella desulfatans TaxID=2750659 RepID=A0A6C2U390_PONDE|nr:hypothetical protein [Pontiella desulfatans]VGO14460.1 hypothetical protein PDESU_03022 [Pontiella desulfatans]
MEIKNVRVRKRELTCRNCDTEFFGYTGIQEDADADKLYECNDCGAIFSLPLGDVPALEERIEGKCCPDCDAPLEETLEEKTQAGVCPMCEDRDYYGSGESEEVQLETFRL